MTRTKNHKQNTGIGNYQTYKAYKARWSILKTLSDGQWHRNMELKNKTRLSSRTLAKHLNQMTNLQIIERKTDVKSGKYPVPVLYKAEPELKAFIKASMTREEVLNALEPALNETKDPLILLEAIHASSQLYFIELLRRIKQNKNITNEEINFYAECFLWANYKQYTSKLIEASYKIINDLNITRSLINQAKRQIIVYTTVLKIYEKMEQKNIHDVPRTPRRHTIGTQSRQTKNKKTQTTTTTTLTTRATPRKRTLLIRGFPFPSTHE